MKQGKISISFLLQRSALLDRNIYMARPDIYTQIEMGSVITYAAKAAGIHESDMVSTLDALVDAFSYYICNGHSFKLDGVGTFSLSLSASTADPTNPVAATGASAVQSVGINFLPDKSLKQMLTNTSITCVAVNPNGLAEDPTPMLTSISSPNYSLSCVGMGLGKGFCLEPGTITLKGYNFSKNTKVVVTGEDERQVANLVPKMINASCNVALCAYEGSVIPVVRKVALYEGEQLMKEMNVTGSLSEKLSVTIGNVALFDGAVITAGSYNMTVRGSEIAGVAVKLDNNSLTPLSATASQITFNNVVLTEGAHRLTVGDKTYNFNVSAQPSANVSRLTSNGVTVNNGGTSTMLAGRTYTMVASGTYLNLLSASDIVATGNLTLSNKTINANQVKFDVTVEEGWHGEGSLSIGGYFRVNITVPEGADGITSVGNIQNNGMITYNGNGEQKYDIVGSIDLAAVTAYVAPYNNPSAAVVSPAVYVDAEGSKLVINNNLGTVAGSSIIYLRDGDTTLFKLNISLYTGGDDTVYE